jgi:protein-tyrosine kinase
MTMAAKPPISDLKAFYFKPLSAITLPSERNSERILAHFRHLTLLGQRLVLGVGQSRVLPLFCQSPCSRAVLQEPDLRMQKETKLGSRPQDPADLELSAMTEEKSGTRPDGRGVSLFKKTATPVAQPSQDLSTGREIFANGLPSMFLSPMRVWESLGAVSLDPAHLAANGLFLEASDHPAASGFDMLRTRLLHGLAEKGWRRVAVTSPTHGCGKSFVATNLALSLSRRPASRSVLIDLDLRHPEIARTLGIAEDRALGEFLSGEQPLEGVFRRYGRSLALGLNATAIERASETLHDPDTVAALAAVVEQLDPEVVLYDLPPALVSDDVLALGTSVDAVLLVTDGTKTTPGEIRAVEKMLEGRIPLLGVVLNRAQDFNAGRYRYAKK